MDIDEDEKDYIVVTELGRNVTRNDGHQLINQRRFRRESQSSNSQASSSQTAKTITAPEGSNITRPLSERSAFTERGTDTSSTIIQDNESVATEEPSSEDWSESHSTMSEGTVREGSELIFEYDEDDDTSSVGTVCDFRQGLPRPKTGWNTSSFPSFETIVPAGYNSLLFPQAPSTGRLYWMVGTGGQYGHNSGVNDDQYLNRIEQVMAPRIHSRQTTDMVKNILSKRPDLMPRNSNWAALTQEAWQKKFPDSSIYPDTVYQKTRDPIHNPNLPIDQFASDDIEWLKQRPLDEKFETKRKQKPVGCRDATTENQWTDEDFERVQNQAHVARATNQVQESMQPDNRLMEAWAEFDTYVNFFMEEGHKWQKPAGLTTYVSNFKNVAEQESFERAMFLTKRNGPLMYFHPRWLKEAFRDIKGNFILQLNSAEISEMHEAILRFLSMASMARNFERLIQMLR